MEKTSTDSNFLDAKEEYCKRLAQWFGDVKFAGIAVAGLEVEKSEKAIHIFVMPDVVEEVKPTLRKADAETDITSITDIARNSFTTEAIDFSKRQQELIREQRQLVQWENSLGRKFSAEKLLSESTSEKLVLLGAPGSGKTTLMSYFAVMLALKQPQKLGLATGTDLLPILIRIRDLSRYSKISILEYIHQFTHNTLSFQELPSGFFEYWLEAGQGLILLDGLDEVADSTNRYEIVNRIESFLDQFSRNRAIITSRPAGYRRDFFRTQNLPHYQLQPFDDAKIDEFINRWYDSRVSDVAEAQRRKDSLRKALSDNDRIKLLAQNPLLLTIISLIHRYQAHLPKERYKLYDKAVETLLTSWDANKEFSNHLVFKYLWLEDLRRLLEKLAYWIHTQGGTGDKQGGTLIDKDELIHQLSAEIKTLKQIQPHEAEEEARRFVEFIRDRTGLLNEQGQDCYAFVHKTFQEYLCAQEIIYQWYDEGDFGIVLQHIKQHLHEPHWREVLLLLVAQQKPKQAAKTIRAILDQHSEYEKWLHRDLLFAGSCLAENLRDLKVADDELPQQILQELVELEASDSPQVTSKIRSRVFEILCSLNETAFETQALQLLKDRAEHIDKVRLQEYRAALGEKEAAITTLVTLLKDKSSKIRKSAAEALGKLGNSLDVVVQGLLALLNDQDLTVRYYAEALSNLGNSSDFVVQGLLALLKDKDSTVRSLAAEALGKLGNSSDFVVQGLLALLNDQDSIVRLMPAEALGNLGNSSDFVVHGLLALLNDQVSTVRFIATLALGKLGNSSDFVVQTLLALLKDKSSIVRYSAADALGKLGNSSDFVVQTLLALLKDEDSTVRYSAADALGKLGNSSDFVVQTLLALLKDKHSSVRFRAANALGNLGNSSDFVVQGLLALLKDQHSTVRYHAADALGNLGNSSDFVVQTLLALLKDKHSTVRYNAADALGNLGKKTPSLATAVAQWIEQHQDSRYVGNGIDLLWDLVTSE
ncbi:HEAT repeat domain-containing protein [Brasilonema sp. CT11]|nr:HEAT repeat domain-containing protein [Brasilonema sp. CT11]